jgi:tRNA modification GTPase
MDRPRETSDTIAAVSTPPGKGAISIIRMSGEHAFDVAATLFRPDTGALPEKPARGVMVGILYDPGRNRRIDRAVLLTFPGPGSYTGEDVVEFHCHGGDITPQLVLRALLEAGCRQAEKGEFTLRAYLNDRIDLLQAESVLDVIEAGSEFAQREAVLRLEGSLSRIIDEVREGVLALCAKVEYFIDFPEEDEPLEGLEGERERATSLIGKVNHLLETALDREIVNRGALTVIAGAPNVGKSSLFNLLLETERAIVTPQAGTTRDAVEASLDLGDVPILLVDTAGLHHATETIEVKGIEFTKRYLERADVIIFVLEANRNPTEDELDFLGDYRNRCVVVVNKSDLGVTFNTSSLEGNVTEGPAVIMSCLRRTGINNLLSAVARTAGLAFGVGRQEGPSITIRARHRAGLTRARDGFLRFRDGLSELPPEVLAIELREACSALEELTGKITTDDILDRIFDEFCVGK